MTFLGKFEVINPPNKKTTPILRQVLRWSKSCDFMYFLKSFQYCHHSEAHRRPYMGEENRKKSKRTEMCLNNPKLS